MKPRLLDLFCGAGGASAGYVLAGFEVIGVDIEPQPRYPFEFVQGDALAYLADHAGEFFAIHASPPCQAHTALQGMKNNKAHLDLIPATRDLLMSSGKPWVIENVPGAPLLDPVLLCGTMFDLGCDEAQLQRHRLFESNLMILAPACRHDPRLAVIGIYGGHVRNRKRAKGDHAWTNRFSIPQAKEAMEIDWMTLGEMSQAIPPAFTRFIGDRFMQELKSCGSM